MKLIKSKITEERRNRSGGTFVLNTYEVFDPKTEKLSMKEIIEGQPLNLVYDFCYQNKSYLYSHDRAVNLTWYKEGISVTDLHNDAAHKATWMAAAFAEKQIIIDPLNVEEILTVAIQNQPSDVALYVSCLKSAVTHQAVSLQDLFSALSTGSHYTWTPEAINELKHAYLAGSMLAKGLRKISKPADFVEGKYLCINDYTGQVEFRQDVRTRYYLKEHTTAKIDQVKTPTAPEGLNQKQAEAFNSAFNNPLTVLCGSAGTGKTHTVGKIVHAAIDAGWEVKLMAFTHRAAQRMTQFTGEILEASTAHSLLGITVRAIEHPRVLRSNNHPNPTTDITPIDSDIAPFSDLVFEEEKVPKLLIVDEASLISSYIMHHISTAAFKEYNLLIVGDPKQLEPVGGGTPFLDLVPQAITLDEIYRQASDSPIITAAYNVVEGLPIQIPNSEEFEIVSSLDVANIPEEAMILCPLQKPRTGCFSVVLLNNLIKQYRFGSKSVPPAFTRYGEVYYKGEKVMFIKNGNGVVNGDTGIFTGHNKSDGLLSYKKDSNGATVLFPDALVATQPGYAMSVHKAQGSEWDHVVLFLPPHPMSENRRLLYSALTRAKKKVTIVDPSNVLREGRYRV